jgi:Calcineurin-like phosphoesterase.
MLYITGDTHRDFRRIFALCDTVNSTKNDILIILGDAGINYSGEPNDSRLKQELAQLPITLFCIHGNHEMRPQAISSYQKSIWYGGTVLIEPEYPNLIFAKDGEVYNIDDRSYLAIGGAYSVDKEVRLLRGHGWWADEQPSAEIKADVEHTLNNINFKTDIVLSHTCPLKYEPVEMFLSGIDQSKVDKSTEVWLDNIEDRLTYQRWYCGHYHTDKTIDKLRFLFQDILQL